MHHKTFISAVTIFAGLSNLGHDVSPVTAGGSRTHNSSVIRQDAATAVRPPITQARSTRESAGFVKRTLPN